MEAVVNSIVSNLNTFINTTKVNGGCSDIIGINAVYWGDPGILPVNQFPLFTVQPVRDVPQGETTGYEMRDLHVQITLLIDSRDYFDKYADEATGDRIMVETMEQLRAWFRRASKRTLDGLTGVRDVKVTATDYMVQVRGSVIAKSAQITLVVNQQFTRQK